MMKRLSITLCLCLSGIAQAQDPALRNYCAATPEEQRVADATALLIPLNLLTYNAGSNTYSAATAPTTSLLGLPLCSDEPLYGQLRVTQGRTAFLVGDDLLVTAPHFPTFSTTNYAAVFGLHHRWVGNSCVAPDFAQIPAANVYPPPSSGKAHVFSTLQTPPLPGDYLMFRVNRPVAGVAPLPLRRYGKPELGDPLLIAGHYNQLPVQVTAATVTGLSEQGVHIGAVAAADGSSGSPVYNLNKKLVETIIADPTRGLAMEPDSSAGCHRLKISSANINSGTAVINNRDMLPFANAAPVPGVPFTIVTPHPVPHARKPDGSFTHAVSAFTVKPSTTVAVAHYRVEAADKNGAEIDVSPDVFFVGPGSTPVTFTVTTNPSANPQSCGLFRNAIKIRKTSPNGGNEVVAVVPQNIDSAATDFTLSPSGPWTPSGLGPPYLGQQVVQLRNSRLNPVTLNVTSDKSWLLVNGTTGTSVNLGPAGSATETASITLSLAQTDQAVSDPKGTISVTPSPAACSVSATKVFEVALDRQTASRTAVATELLSGPGPGQTYGPPLQFDLDFSLGTLGNGGLPHYNVGDVDFEIGFSPYSMPSLTSADTSLKVEIQSPDNTIATVWNLNDAPAYYWTAPRILDSFGGSFLDTVSVLSVNAPIRPTLGPQPLSTFNGLTANGIWKVRLYSTDASFIPLWVKLKVTRQ